MVNYDRNARLCYSFQGKPLRSKTQAAIATGPPGGGIKRSKSLGSADILSGGQAKDLPDFANFPTEVQAAIHRAIEGQFV